MATTYRAKTGRKWKNNDLSAKEYRDKRQAEVKELLDALDEWKADRTEAELADLLSRWDGYHGNNPHLIEMGSRSLATDVDARGAWLERGRVPIGKGTGIKVVAPIVKKADDPAKPGKKKDKVIGYRIVYVFDIRHTIDLDLRSQWNEDHPEDENGARHWGDEEEITAWHARNDDTRDDSLGRL